MTGHYNIKTYLLNIFLQNLCRYNHNIIKNLKNWSLVDYPKYVTMKEIMKNGAD